MRRACAPRSRWSSPISESRRHDGRGPQQGSLDRSSIEARLKLSLRDTPKANGFGVGYRRELRAGIHARRERDQTHRRVRALRHTNKGAPAASWYVDTLGKGAPRWTEPIFPNQKGSSSPNTPRRSISPAASGPLRRSRGRLYPDITLLLDRSDSEDQPGGRGYNFIVSRAGKFIAHPDHLFLGTKYQLQGNRLDEEESDQEQAAVPLLGNSVYHKKGDTDRSLPSWMFFEPLAGTGWSLATIVYHNIFAPEGDIRVRALIGIIAAFVGFGNFFVLWIVSREVRSSHSLWAASMLMTAIFVAGILAIWHFPHKYPQMQSGRDVIIASNSKLDQFERDLKVRCRAASWRPAQGPDGSHHQQRQVHRDQRNDALGFIWQKYPLKMPAGGQAGLCLCGRARSPGRRHQRGLPDREEDKLVIGWNFRDPAKQVPPSEIPVRQRGRPHQAMAESLGGGLACPDLDDYEFLAPEKGPASPTTSSSRLGFPAQLLQF